MEREKAKITGIIIAHNSTRKNISALDFSSKMQISTTNTIMYSFYSIAKPYFIAISCL